MQREYMYELLAKMKEGNRQAFHAFYDATYQDVYRFHDYTLEEIAVLLQFPPGAVKSRYHAGLEALRKYVRNLPPERKIREHLQQKAETMECPPTISRRIKQSYSHYLQQNGHDRFVDRKRSHPIS